MPAYNYNTRTLEGSNSPSGRYNPVTPGGIYGDATGGYSWGQFGGDATRFLISSQGGPLVPIINQVSGGRALGWTDRMFGAQNAHEARDYRNHMRDMLKEDARAYNPGVMGSLSEFVSNLFGGGRGNSGAMSNPRGNMPAFLGQGNGSRPEHSTNLTAGYGIDAEGNTVIPRYSWEEGYGEGDEAESPYGDGQGMGRGEAASPPKPAQNYQGNRAGTGGQVVAQRMSGNSAEARANNRALESMAEGLLGQDAVSRMNASSRQSIDMMNRMFGNKFK